ncbi:NADH:flavin oxidoreductase [Paraburkholderia dipogonis]|nr:NADH:flavin oxidoreductase [Paraburkholderia dipogonis]
MMGSSTPERILWDPLRIGRMEVRGRVYKAATSETRATADGYVTDELLEFYAPIADGGTPLIVTGNIGVSQQGHSSGRMMMIDHDDKLPGLRRLVESVKPKGAKLVAQLNHGGRQTIRNEIRNPIVSASSVRDASLGTKPRALTREEIASVVGSFADAAERAREAGFDGIQLHFAHGYLVSQFMTPHTNRRNDEYGGTLRNRIRLPLEILRAVRKRVGDDFPILAKINCTDSLAFRHGATRDDFLTLGKAMEDEGLDAVELSRAHYESVPPMMSGSYAKWTETQIHDGVGRGFSPGRKRLGLALAPLIDAVLTKSAPKGEGYNLPFAMCFKKHLKIPVITNGGFLSKDAMEAAVANGHTDAVSCARAIVANPYLFKQLYESVDDAPACRQCNGCVARVGVHKVDCYEPGVARLRRLLLSGYKPAVD